MAITQTKPQPAVLSEQLRQSSAAFLPQRRGIAGLSLLAVGSLSLITLFQVGILKHLPEVPLPGLHMDSEKVNASSDAYGMFEVPDGIIGLGSYTATLGLAAMGGQNRARKQPWLPLLLMAKLGFDTYQAITLIQTQRKDNTFCFWCLLTAGATFASLPLAFPEMLTAIRCVFKRD